MGDTARDRWVAVKRAQEELDTFDQSSDMTRQELEHVLHEANNEFRSYCFRADPVRIERAKSVVFIEYANTFEPGSQVCREVMRDAIHWFAEGSAVSPYARALDRVYYSERFISSEGFHRFDATYNELRVPGRHFTIGLKEPWRKQTHENNCWKLIPTDLKDAVIYYLTQFECEKLLSKVAA